MSGAEFSEWNARNADDADDDEAEMFRDNFEAQRDAVLFLVDARSSMFNDRDHTSAFKSALECVKKFYQDKVIASERDLVGFVLFNTREALNGYGFPNVYVFHELDPPSATRVRELVSVANAGVSGSSERKEFEDMVGHSDQQQQQQNNSTTTTTTTNVKKESGGRGAAKFSDALWAAQHVHNHSQSKKIAFRRVIIFTDDEDPAKGSRVELERCEARMRDLSDAGIELSVFAHGFDPSSASSTATAGRASAKAGDEGTVSNSASGTTASNRGSAPPQQQQQQNPSFMNLNQQQGSNLATTTAGTASTSAVGYETSSSTSSGGGGGGVSNLPPFDTRVFWRGILRLGADQQQDHQGSSSSSTSSLPLLFDSNNNNQQQNNNNVEKPRGEISVNDAIAKFDQLLQDVRKKTHPQRSLGSLKLRVGGSDASAPYCVVAVFAPVMKCHKPRTTYLTADHNIHVVSETQTVSSMTGQRVAVSDSLFTVSVGSARIPFTLDDIRQTKELCAPDGAGVTIVAFKPRSWLQEIKWNTGRSSFLHPHSQFCDTPGVRFFACLWRVLRDKDNIAVAEIVPRAGAAPHMCALIPATPATSDEHAVTGAGFHVKVLPYSEDYRTLVYPKPREVGDDDVTRAKRIIKRMSVADSKGRYVSNRVPNPALHRQYDLLQRLAMQDTAELETSGDGEPVQVTSLDLTLPDADEVERKAGLAIESLKDSLVPTGYDPSTYAGTSSGAKASSTSSAKKDPTDEDLEKLNFDKLQETGALKTLTVPYLKAFLKKHQLSTSGAKAEIVERVSFYVASQRRQSGAIRQRDE